MSKIRGRSTIPGVGGSGDSVTTDGTKLSLRGLLHYLWDQAELTRWQPGFSGKRSWATVRKHLLLAAENKTARGGQLHGQLYIPEVFSVDQRDAINARRLVRLAHATVTPGKAQQLMLLIAEVKEIVPARYGFKAVIKHVPDQAFVLDEQLYRRLGLRFQAELSLWGAAGNVHMMMIATFGVSAAGMVTIGELSLMPVTSQWLPIEDAFEKQVVEMLVRDGRSFVKGLRYNLSRGMLLANAILTDTGDAPVPLFIAEQGSGVQHSEVALDELTTANVRPAWVWRPEQGKMPPLPLKAKPRQQRLGPA